ncbi:CG9672 [Drosophila busckii]|uniref:trypsin n=1 Tax=Drosophila busckii TaxID=30019 RepID=A0A0M5J387_DROBS|nr:chymotrypsin-1 [Drosophila busckii]ALC48948.1 CG9672 [Drosophila busckii]
MKLAVSCVVLSALLGCSLAMPEGRVAGGDDAELGQLPYQGALSIGGSYNCGAAIIAPLFALTALTCVCSEGSNRPWPPQMFQVSAGTIDLYQGGQRIVVEEIILNPNYNELQVGMALLRLRQPFVFNDQVQAIALATVNPPIGAEIDISGWGRTKATETDMHRTLQIGNAYVEPERACLNADSSIQSNDQVLCVGHSRKQGICRGDMGGPAVYNNELVGLGVQLLGECGGSLPERFISIAANYDWIQSQIA